MNMEIIVKKLISNLAPELIKEGFTFWNKGRIKKNQALILKELRGGKFDNLQEDELFSIMYQFVTAIQLGTAENNLRLMARVAKGMSLKNKLTPHSFLRYSKMLADLSEEEILVLGTIVEYYLLQKKSNGTYYNQPVQSAIEKLSKKEYLNDRCQSIIFGLLRTGFFNINAKLSTYKDDNSISIDISILFKEFMEFCPNFDDLITEKS